MNIKVKMYIVCVKYWIERKFVCICYDWYRGDYNCLKVGIGWYIWEINIYIYVEDCLGLYYWYIVVSDWYLLIVVGYVCL